MEFNIEFSYLAATLEEYAANSLKNRLSFAPDSLRDAILYAFNSGGKRIRPVLFLHFYSKNKPIDEEALNFALAIECLHNYTLIHDDLPCMDDDEYRRGKPTVHVLFGETTAVLAGDSLLNLSYELLSDGLVKSMHKDDYAKALASFSAKTGANGLIGGQIIDTCISNKGKEDVFYIYKHKTGDLFAASCECAAILCGNDDKSAEEFGYALGQLFQATDDALDDDNLSAKKILNEQEFEDLLNKSKEKCISLARKYNDDFLITLVDKIAERKN